MVRKQIQNWFIQYLKWDMGYHLKKVGQKELKLVETYSKNILPYTISH